MRRRLIARSRGFLIAAAAALALSAPTNEALAQAHEARQGPYVLRSSAVATQQFDAAAARRHGIEPAPNRAVLNITVLREQGQTLRNVPASISATASDLTGRKREITMRPVTENEMVSYIGAFDFLPRQVVRMEIEATPRGAERPLRLSYEERMWVP